MKATLDRTMGTEAVGHSAWPASDEAMYVAIVRAWCRLVVPEHRGLFPLGPFVLGPVFVESVARAPVDGLVVAGLCAEVASRFFAIEGGGEPESEVRRGQPAVEVGCPLSWWRPLGRGDAFGVFYGERPGYVLEFLLVGRRGEGPPSGWGLARE